MTFFFLLCKLFYARSPTLLKFQSEKVVSVTLIICLGYFSEENIEKDGKGAFMYYVNDGVYGSFNCLLYDHAEVEARLVNVGTPVFFFFSTSFAFMTKKLGDWEGEKKNHFIFVAVLATLVSLYKRLHLCAPLFVLTHLIYFSSHTHAYFICL